MILFNHSNPAFKIRLLDYTYTCEPSINSALPLKESRTKSIIFWISCLLSLGFVWIVSKWSGKNKAILLYNVCNVGEASHFLIEEEDVKIESSLIKREDRFDIKKKKLSIAFIYHERTYLYQQQKQSFLPIRFQDLGLQLDHLKKKSFVPYGQVARPQLNAYYGPNVINLPIQSRLQIFIQEMLTPYQVFQTYAIILWIIEQYYIFSLILLFYSLYTYWCNSNQFFTNQQKLAKQSYFHTTCQIIIRDGQSSLFNSSNNNQIKVTTPKTNIHQTAKPLFVSLPNILPDQFNEEIEAQMHIDIPNANSQSLISEMVIRAKRCSSYEIVPGDLIILNEGDIVPCDCILISGQILVDESYTTGESFFVRKTQLQQFTYLIEKEKTFMLYLGTRIIKVKSQKSKRLSQPNSIGLQLTHPTQIICLVTSTNYNTHRGKYLRAIRYQKKQKETFTIETIYFLYILILITTLAFSFVLSKIHQGLSRWDTLMLYLDMIFVAVPSTLPTALSVGINFAQLRLKKYNIHCVLPETIMTGGRVNTIVLEGDQALGKQYEVDSLIIGCKADRALGYCFYSYDELKKYLKEGTEGIEMGRRQKIQMERQGQQKQQQVRSKPINSSGRVCQRMRLGEMMLNAMASCHTLQFYEGEVQGQLEEKKIYQYIQSSCDREDQFSIGQRQIQVNRRIYFHTKENKLAVIATIDYRQQANGVSIEEIEEAGDVQMNRFSRNGGKNVIFIKGAPQKILCLCSRETYPESSLQYIVDMAEKGFLLYAYAYRQFSCSQKIGSQKQIIESLRKDYKFLGFVILKRKKHPQTELAIKIMKNADLNLILVSEQQQLQANSIAILNGFYNKNQLILCSLSKQQDQVICKGHIQWVSQIGPNAIDDFIQSSIQFSKNSSLSVTAALYDHLFIRRNSEPTNHFFQKCKIFSAMQYKHQRNLYLQLQKRQAVSFAVGGGGILSECANISLELHRSQSSLLSSFHSKQQSLLTIIRCLRICRAGLSTNFHCFSMMILFSMVQFTTLCLLNYYYQTITDSQMLYQDLFITFPIFITLNMTKPAQRLSKERPIGSFFSLRALLSMIGQVLIQFTAQYLLVTYLLGFQKSIKMEMLLSEENFKEFGFQQQTMMANSLFVLSNYLYLGIVLSTSVSKPFRKPFYTNPYYTLNLVVLWLYNTFIVIAPSLTPDSMRLKNITNGEENILMLALVYGNLIMLIMYMYENLLVWIWQPEQSQYSALEHIQ